MERHNTSAQRRGTLDYIVTADTGRVETRQHQLRFQTELESSDQITVVLNDTYELLEAPFEPGVGVSIPIGGYDFRDVEVSYQLGQQHRANGTVSLRRGGYFGGDITSLDFNQGYVELTKQLSVEPSVSVNWIDVPQGAFRTDLVRTPGQLHGVPVDGLQRVAAIQLEKPRDCFAPDRVRSWVSKARCD